MRVADAICQFLKEHGVEHVFMVSGGGSIFLNDALAVSGIKYICCHHEQAAAMAAEGYARATGETGVVFVTSGPGGSNAITGVVGAWTDSVPMLVISGQSFLSQTRGNSGCRSIGVQELNIADLVFPITKFSAMVTSPSLAIPQLMEAWRLAKDKRPGPVWLDIPADIQNADCP